MQITKCSAAVCDSVKAGLFIAEIWDVHFCQVACMHSSLLLPINPVARQTALATNYTCTGLWHLTCIFTSAAHFSNYISVVHTSCYVFITPALIHSLPSCVNETDALISSSSSMLSESTPGKLDVHGVCTLEQVLSFQAYFTVWIDY